MSTLKLSTNSTRIIATVRLVSRLSCVAGVHDCRGKCMRGDDFTQNLSMHHNVIFNCGEGPVGTDGQGQSFGVVLKGDHNEFYA